MKTLPNIEGLTSTELISGLLLYIGSRKFSEQSLYRFLRTLETESPSLRERLRIAGPDDRLRSEPVRRIINYLEMGKILEVAMPNPVDQFFRPRSSQLESVRRQLTQRGVLPIHEEVFKELASGFTAFTSSSVT
ncbi:MAG: hypothetical protein HY735_32890 [Verrucomicrobia bacterium]|nr:hypothetical protein [Verrucomicrobiota bacterium]